MAIDETFRHRPASPAAYIDRILSDPEALLDRFAKKGKEDDNYNLNFIDKKLAEEEPASADFAIKSFEEMKKKWEQPEGQAAGAETVPLF